MTVTLCTYLHNIYRIKFALESFCPSSYKIYKHEKFWQYRELDICYFCRKKCLFDITEIWNEDLFENKCCNSFQKSNAQKTNGLLTSIPNSNTKDRCKLSNGIIWYRISLAFEFQFRWRRISRIRAYFAYDIRVLYIWRKN